MNQTKAPAAIDPVATANAQTAANKDTAITQARLNNYDQIGPGGSLTYSETAGTDGTPKFTATQALSPVQQALYDKTNAIYGGGLDIAQTLQGQLSGTLGNAAPQFDETYRTQTLANILSRQQPQLDRDRSALETQLANQGIGIGSQAYDDAMGTFNSRLNDLNLGADLQAGNEARSAYATQLGGRTQGINELTGLLGLGQVQGVNPVQTPQTGVQGTDILGAQQLGMQSGLNAYNQGQAANRSMIGGLSGLGAAGFGGWAQGGFKNPF